jgi:hypothetical protein
MVFRAFAVLATMLSVLIVPGLAEGRTRVVYISGSNSGTRVEEAVVAGLRTKLVATGRYQLGQSKEAEIEVQVVCIDLSQVINKVQGAVCSFNVTYWPDELAGLSIQLLAPSMTIDADPGQIAGHILEKTLDAATETALAGALKSLRGAVAYVESRPKR